MVSADSLNLDVLELICSFLNNNDLAAVALVSKSFLAGAIPSLYRTLSFRVHHAKRYPSVSTSFAMILAHPNLAVHVRNIDIRVVPLLMNKPHPDFVQECTRTLGLCNSLRSFVYTSKSVLIPSILPVLQGKEGLKKLRIYAKLSTTQASMLLKLDNVERLELDSASWEVLDILPRWTQEMQKTLVSLTLSMSMDLNPQVLQMTLEHLPRLQGLHIICPETCIDHTEILKLVTYTPLLESLAFTVTEMTQPLDTNNPLPTPTLVHLRHLALDVRSCFTASPSTPETLLTVLTTLKAAFVSLTSITLRIRELTTEAGHALMLQLVEDHAATLRRLTFVASGVEMRSISALCQRCQSLEVLSMPLPMKEILAFSNALASSSTLHTLVDGDGHIAHGPRPALNCWIAHATSADSYTHC
ncbi:hypothetical protein E4T56_gene4354 [Termitomyces sp. T112]|nr:hypothetical protein E4T56_gene4354 [Termitomyces sp. T112]